MLDALIERCGGKPFEGDNFAKVKKEENGVTEDGEIKENEREETYNPLNDYGFGIVAYFNILFSVFLILFVLSFFAAALM
jgi:hypothetical protein